MTVGLCHGPSHGPLAFEKSKGEECHLCGFALSFSASMISFILASGTNQPGTVGVKASLAGILVTSLSAGITTTLAVLQLVKQTIKRRIK